MDYDDIKSHAQDVAKKLDETNEDAIRQIELLIEHMGNEFVDSHVEKALKTQAGDGLMTDDGKRKRSTGGVFFYQVKGDMPEDKRQMVFVNFGSSSKGKVVLWSERQPLVEGLQEDDDPGAATGVTVTLQGNVESVKTEDSTTVALVTHRYTRTPLLRGVPQPPADPVMYAVYMPTEKWERISKRLSESKEDEIVVEGVFYPDAETDTYAILASRISTSQTDDELEKEAIKKAKETAIEEYKASIVEDDVEADDDNSDDANTDTAERDDESPAAADETPAEKSTAAKATTNGNQIGGYAVPDAMPEDAVEELKKLTNAAAKFRERIQKMEAENQPGVKMTKRLLSNTEKKIKSLLSRHGA